MFGFYWLLIPVQVIAWKDSSPKWSIMCREDVKLYSLTHSLTNGRAYQHHCCNVLADVVDRRGDVGVVDDGRTWFNDSTAMAERHGARLVSWQSLVSADYPGTVGAITSREKIRGIQKNWTVKCKFKLRTVKLQCSWRYYCFPSPLT